MEKSKLTDQDREPIEEAIRTSERLHLDDIHEVAAALRTKSGEIFTGIHIEANVGFADVCGEVAAICTMVSAGHRDLDTIVGGIGDGKGNLRIMSPCGRCRELISDFNPEAWVILGNVESPYKVKISDLLPMKSE